MIEFLHPWLLLLLLLPVLLAVVMWFTPPPSVVVASVAPFRKKGRRRAGLCFWQWMLVASAAVTVVALSRPRLPVGDRMIRARGVDIVLALDMSGSMETFDRPHGVSDEVFVRELENGAVPSRLDAAKAEIRRFIEMRPNDRIGLIGFADLAYSFVPPTLDHELLLTRLADLRAGELGNATGIASPIGIGVRRLKDSASPRRVLVLFTDGANTAENRLTPQAAAQLAKDFNIIIHTVGIGSRNAFAIVPTPLGRQQLVRAGNDLDDQLLRDLAEVSGGSYFAAADRNGMRHVMDEINALERTDHRAPKSLAYREFAPWAALLAAALLVIGIAVNSFLKPRLP